MQTRPAGGEAPAATIAVPGGIDPAVAPAAAQAAPGGEVRALPLSREEFVDSLADLRAQGSLDLADEAAVLREYDQLLTELKLEKSQLESEFRERSARDGMDAAQGWLSEAAGALGRRQGLRMRQLFQTIPALQPPAPA